MDTLQRIMEISSRIEHLENIAEWMARETVHLDNSLSQTSTLVMVLADDIREKFIKLVKELEEEQDLEYH